MALGTTKQISLLADLPFVGQVVNLRAGCLTGALPRADGLAIFRSLPLNLFPVSTDQIPVRPLFAN